LIYLTRELARRYPQLKVAAVHPGRVNTGMGTALLKDSPILRVFTPIGPMLGVPLSIGVRNHLWVATSPDVVSGKYYEPVGIPDGESKAARDDSLYGKLWEWTESELKGIVPQE
jgi:retinol dehydrogenase 12